MEKSTGVVGPHGSDISAGDEAGVASELAE